MKNSSIYIVFVLAVLLALYALSAGKHPPFIPVDHLHAGIRKDATCMTCHAPGMQAPLKASHPPKAECLICHKQKEKKL